MEGDLPDQPVIIQPDAKFVAQTGVQIEDFILIPDDQEQVYLTAVNPAHNFQKLLPHTLIGQVESLADAEPLTADTRPNQADGSDHTILSVTGHKPTILVRRAQLENQLHICPDGRTWQEVASLRKCILNSSDIFAV